MCAMLKELQVPLAELTSVVITCTRCKSDVTFNLLLEKQNPNPMAKTSATPEMCPVCEVKYSQHAQLAVDSLRDAYKELIADKSLTVSFRVRSDVALP
jgi:hypothetical protein